MSISASRSISISYSGDITGTELYAAIVNNISPGIITGQTLAIGANTIVVPVGATACTIIPPSGNVGSILLKSVTGDVGISLNQIDPSSISLDPSTVSFCLTVSTVMSIRLLWT